MKPPHIHHCLFFAMLCAVLDTTAQTSFEAMVESPRRLWGRFGLLDDRVLISSVQVEFAVGGDTVQIFRSTSPAQLGDLVVTLYEQGGYYPGPNGEGSIGWFFGGGRSLTDPELEELRGGLWWINVNPSPAGSEFRAQITPVPEPATYVLITIGSGIVWFIQRRRTTTQRGTSVDGSNSADNDLLQR